MTKAAVAFLGGLDTLVISAGTSGITPILTASLAEFRAICDANLTSTFLACRYGAPHMVASGSGSIIAISSVFGLVGTVLGTILGIEDEYGPVELSEDEAPMYSAYELLGAVLDAVVGALAGD